MEYFVLSRSDNKMYNFNHLYHDSLGAKLSIPSLYFPDDNHFVVQYQALDFKNIIQDEIENGDVPELKRDRLKQPAHWQVRWNLRCKRQGST